MGCGARTQTLPIARTYLASAYIQGVSQLLTVRILQENCNSYLITQNLCKS